MEPFDMLGLDNPIHILFLLILLLLVFGAKRLPEMGRSLGTGMRGFKETLSGEASHEARLPSPDQDGGSPTAHAQAQPSAAEPRP
jgi:sec-independent protein translocase protein TatA